MEIVEPGYKVPCSKTIKARLRLKYNEIKQKIEEELANAESVSLTIDEWSSRSQDTYLSVEAQFFNNFAMQHVTLANKPLEGRATAANIAGDVQSVVGDWNLTGKVQALIHDSAATMNAVGNLLEDSIKCSAHLLQLSIKDGLNSVPNFQEICKEGRAITSHFHHSNVARKALKASQTQLKLNTEKLIQRCDTRWDASFYMCESLLRNRNPISLVLSDRKVTKPAVAAKLTLSEADWTTMENLCKLLKPFQLATTILCSETACISSSVLPIIIALVNKHMMPLENDRSDVLTFKETIFASLKLRFELEQEDTSAFLFASFLDPRHKNLDFVSSTVKDALLKSIEHQLLALESSNEERTSEPQTTTLDFLYQETSSPSDCKRQLELYKSELQIGHNLDLLIWWKDHSEMYPSLLKLASKYISIPATSAGSERTFSAAGNIVTEKRSCLLPQNVDLLTFLYKNRNYLWRK